MRALIIQHDHMSGSGYVGEALRSLGYDIDDFLVVPEHRYLSPDVGVSFPDPGRYDLIVPMGAPWSVYDDATIGSWVHDELDFLGQAQVAGVAILGICFGGQLLAKVNGGDVIRAAAPEIGWYLIESDDPQAIPPGPWFQWHYDRFVLPAGANEVARNSAASQAFRIGRSLGLQFHPEIDPIGLMTWMDEVGKEQVRQAGLDPETLLQVTKNAAPFARAAAFKLVGAFHNDIVLSAPAAVQRA